MRRKKVFRKLQGKLTTISATTTKGLTDAISKLRTVLGTTETVVENVTGGNSYAYVYPKFELGSIGPVYLFIHNNGDQILSGVSIKVDRVVSGTYDGTYHDLHSIRLKELIPVGGTLAAHWGAMLTNSETIPQLGPDRKATYLVLISAQNGGATEEIYFRPSNGGNSLAYQFKVWTKAYGKRRPSDFFNGIQWTRCVMTSDWIEPGQTPPADIQK